MNVDRLLVLKVRALGDTLLATPALRALRFGFPQARITFVASPAGREVLEDNPDLDEIIVYDKNRPAWGYHWRFAQSLAARRFDLAVALHATFRTALLARWSGARQRVIHNHSGRDYFATLEIPDYKRSKSAIERDLDAIRALGLPTTDRLVLHVEPTHHQNVKIFLAQEHLPWQSYLVLNAHSSREAKRISSAAAATFLDLVAELLPLPWVLLAGPDDGGLAENIRALAGSHPPIFRRGLKEAAALIAQSAGMVTTDSGPKHVAAAMDIPTLTLWGNEPEAEWHPYDLTRHALARSETGRVADIPPSDIAAAAAAHFSQWLPRA